MFPSSSEHADRAVQLMELLLGALRIGCTEVMLDFLRDTTVVYRKRAQGKAQGPMPTGGLLSTGLNE